MDGDVAGSTGSEDAVDAGPAGVLDAVVGTDGAEVVGATVGTVWPAEATLDMVLIG